MLGAAPRRDLHLTADRSRGQVEVLTGDIRVRAPRAAAAVQHQVVPAPAAVTDFATLGNLYVP